MKPVIYFFDTSKLYATEDLLGGAFSQSGIPREELTIITKLSMDAHHSVRDAFERSRHLLGTVNIYILRWPRAFAKDKFGPQLPEQSLNYI